MNSGLNKLISKDFEKRSHYVMLSCYHIKYCYVLTIQKRLKYEVVDCK